MKSSANNFSYHLANVYMRLSTAEGTVQSSKRLGARSAMPLCHGRSTCWMVFQNDVIDVQICLWYHTYFDTARAASYAASHAASRFDAQRSARVSDSLELPV
jgi:hypothetical protein